MYYYLAQHPDVYMSARKEPRYFGADLQLREGWRITDEQEYLALFADGADCKYRGEATVYYLYSENAAQEIAEYSPGAKIIIMLREPVGMMLSSHNHFVASCNENIEDFHEAFDAQDDRQRGLLLPDDVWYPEGLQYAKMVSYSQHVKRFFDVFGKENVHVILFDDLKRDTAGTYQDVLEYLEIDSSFKPELEQKNAAPPVSIRFLHRFWIRHPLIREKLGRLLGPKLRKNMMYFFQAVLPKGEGKKPISDEFSAQLRKQFQPEIQQLECLLERDLTHWYQPSTAGQGEAK